MRKKLIIIGASGHGKVVADIAKLSGYEKIEFLDDNDERITCGNYNVIGKVEDFKKHKDCDFIVGIGNGAIINTCSSVDHDCTIEDFVHVSVGAHVADTVYIAEKTWIGAGATVINNINITATCMIGAGAVVVSNIEQEGTYVGGPAKLILK